MLITNLLALFFFLFGIVLIVRALQAPRRDAPKFMRAAAASMAFAAGNLLLLKQPTVGLLMMLAGVLLIFSAKRA